MKVGFLGLLTLLFITLKLLGVVTWSWLAVLSPLWIGFIFWFVLFTAILGFQIWAESKMTPVQRLSRAYIKQLKK